MRAAVLHGLKEPLRIEELELDPPKAGEVSVRMLASGVCHSDVHRADGDWGERPIYPIVLGHEGAGVVAALGGGVTGLGLGQLVALNWYYPCRACGRCAEGREWLCTGSRSAEHLQMDGTTRMHTSESLDVRAYLSIGTFGERTVVPAQAAVALPEGTPPEVAALIGCCVSTGIGAVVNTARLPAGASAVVIGLGGVGLSAVMGAAMRGADPIVAVDLDPAKLDLALDLGASHAVSGADRDRALRQIHRVTGGGAGFAFETAGASAAAELAISSVGAGGTAVLVGLPRDGRPRIVRDLRARRPQQAYRGLAVRVERRRSRLPALRAPLPRRTAPHRPADRGTHRPERCEPSDGRPPRRSGRTPSHRLRRGNRFGLSPVVRSRGEVADSESMSGVRSR
jgi:S-(hydroxymethyl)glutathione dehydrogenase/alcohol dehydrogenase